MQGYCWDLMSIFVVSIWLCYAVLVSVQSSQLRSEPTARSVEQVLITPGYLEPVAFCASQPRTGLANADLCPCAYLLGEGRRTRQMWLGSGSAYSTPIFSRTRGTSV